MHLSKTPHKSLLDYKWGKEARLTIYRGCKLNILHHVLRFHEAINLEK